MTGNSFGQTLTLTTFGESHGPAYGCIVDGCPSGLALTPADIQHELNRRAPGTSTYTSQRQEKDMVTILSGIFNGYTTGTSIGLLIENTHARTKDYDPLASVFRPGHADFSYQKKYKIRDHRGGGRASARETMMRVAAGAIAKKYLKEQIGIHIYGYLAAIGTMQIEPIDLNSIDHNPFFCPDPSKLPAISTLIRQLQKKRDSIGAKVAILVTGMPIGLGEPVFNGLDADLAHALMSINAAKGVEIGDGFGCVQQHGSTHRDGITPTGFTSNHSGGTLGGISTGQILKASIAFKPTSSIPQPISTIDHQNQPTEIIVTGRHDPCVGFRAVPVAEAMVALVLMDHTLRHRAQCG